MSTDPTTPERLRPGPDEIPPGALTRFAPAPTGLLHLGHVANAIYVWGVARSSGGRVLLRIEDHDRQRSRSTYDAALLEDLDWLGFVPDLGPVRQSDDEGPYRAALATLMDAGLAYACTCSRTVMAGWTGDGCAGACRQRGDRDGSGVVLRAALGTGEERWEDLLAGPSSAPVAPAGDLPIRDRHGNWTYALAVVVDDARQGVNLVVRGADLVGATAPQIRLGRALGRAAPPAFLHHGLIRRPDGAKLSKAARDTSVRDLRAAGESPERIIGRAAAALGLIAEARPLAASHAASLFAPG